MIPGQSIMLAAAVAMSVLACGCASAPDQFYMLSADGKLPASGSDKTAAIGIGPVTIPDYIDRDELVFQSSPNRFEVPPEHRWAGALDKTITDVLAANLGHRLNTNAVYSYPWNTTVNLRYAIPVRIRRFHAVSGGDAILDVRWEVRDHASGRTLHRGSQILSESLTVEGYEGVVSAESRLLGKLADAIAATLR